MADRWQDSENQIIRDYYIVGGSKGCHKRLPHRTREAIQIQSSKLSIKGKKGRQIKDLIGNSYGNLTVEERGEDYTSPKGAHQPRWWCRCQCGERILVQAGHLISENTTSCGNCPLLEIGKIYNKWLEPIERVKDDTDPKSKRHYQRFRMKCHYGAEGCKGIFVTRAHSVLSGYTKSCGCLRDKKTRERMAGENSPNWKGGVTELHDAIRTCTKNEIWKKDCRKRDNYTCQKCGKIGGKTNVHHCRIPFWKMLEELTVMGITCVEDIPNDSEFWDINNGITLCEDCHKEFHSIYGNAFTIQDFKIWFLAVTPEFAEELRCG